MTDLDNAFRHWLADHHPTILHTYCVANRIGRLDVRVARVAEQMATEAFSAAWFAATGSDELNDAFQSWVRNDKPALLWSTCAGVHLYGLDQDRLKVLTGVTREAFRDGWGARKRLAQSQGNQGDLFGGGK